MRRYFIFACILVTAVVSIRLCISHFFAAADDSLTDIRQVAADPEAYAGQTLTNRAIMMNWNRFAGKDGRYLTLEMSPDLKKQAENIYHIHGEGREVRITYQLYEWNTLAKIRACQEVEERVRRRSQRRMSLEKERSRLDKPVRKLEAIEKLRLETKAKLQRLSEEKEQLAKELMQFQASEKDKLERISEIEARLQRLSEERAQLAKERGRLLASEEEDKLQQANEIKAKLQQLTEEKKELAKEKDELQPEIKVEAELQRLVNEEARLRRLATDREGREQFNRDKTRLAEEQARSLGRAASEVIIVPPRTPYPKKYWVSSPSRSSRRTISAGPGKRGKSTVRVGQGYWDWNRDQWQRADAERERYAAQKKRKNKLLSQEKKQRQSALRARAQVGRFAKEQVELQRLLKENVELQRAIKEKQRLQRATKEKERLRQLARPKENLRELVKEEANLQRLTRQKEQLQPLAKPNAPRLAAIATELAKIEKAEKTEEQIDFPVGSDGAPLEDINYSGVLWHIRIP
ncbi:MAG: hypothetical protein KAT11_02185 [Phycisphaerae bacterium]|nr:hypothetical protein [Phycisphaerae bacterium]